MAQIETKDVFVEYRDDAATKTAVFNRLLAYFTKHEAFSGESICQRDGPLVDASEVLADIADIVIGFKVTEKE